MHSRSNSWSVALHGRTTSAALVTRSEEPLQN